MIKLITVLLLLSNTTPITSGALSESIYKRYHNKRNAKIYAERIVVESKRRNLDLIAMTAVAWTESLFHWWRIRRNSRGKVESVGVWQLVPYGAAEIAAEDRVQGCKAPTSLRGWYGSHWATLARGRPCEAPEVAAERTKLGRFSISELQNPIISTYIAAIGIRKHIENSRRLGFKPRLIRGCKLDRKLQLMLYRYGHYNSGNRRPRVYYLHRLCERYGILRMEIQNHGR